MPLFTPVPEYEAGSAEAPRLFPDSVADDALQYPYYSLSSTFTMFKSILQFQGQIHFLYRPESSFLAWSADS